MIGTLPSCWIFLGWITNDSISWLISYNVNGFNIACIATIEDFLMILYDQIHHTLYGTRTLMFVEAKFEMHSHEREVVTCICQNDVKWRLVCVSGLKLSE